MFKEGKYVDITINITYNNIWFRDFCRVIVDNID